MTTLCRWPTTLTRVSAPQLSLRCGSPPSGGLKDAAPADWSGYFTSRPALKRQVRMATNFLGAARQMEVASGVTKEEVDLPTTRPSPPVGASWTDSMEGAIAVATHHDGMSGTERQQVANDYDQRISEGHFEAEAGVSLALQRLAGVTAPVSHCNCQSSGACLNISVCAATTGVDAFKAIAWNPAGQPSNSTLRIPVTGAAFVVTDLASGAVLPSQVTALDARTKSLPLLYVNKFGMSGEEFEAASRGRANNATHVLAFRAPLPAAGYASFSVKAAHGDSAAAPAPPGKSAPSTVSNDFYELALDHAAGMVTSIKNLRSGVSTSFNLTWVRHPVSNPAIDASVVLRRCVSRGTTSRPRDIRPAVTAGSAPSCRAATPVAPRSRATTTPFGLFSSGLSRPPRHSRRSRWLTGRWSPRSGSPSAAGPRMSSG